MRLSASNPFEHPDLHVQPQQSTVRAEVEIPINLSDGTPTIGRLFSFRGLKDQAEHVALGLGLFRQTAGANVLVRVHSECLTGDILGSRRCDCGPQLTEAIDQLAHRGGYLLYLRQEGRGIGLYAKIDAYILQDGGLDTFQANRALGYRDDQRDYTVAAQMLSALQVTSIELLTNNPEKVRQLKALGVDVRAQISTGFHETAMNTRYLAAKVASGHQMDFTGRTAGEQRRARGFFS